MLAERLKKKKKEKKGKGNKRGKQCHPKETAFIT